MKKFSIIACIDQKNGIGREGSIPWDLPEDKKYFHRITSTTDQEGKKNAVVMGRKTWDSLPEIIRPMKDRINAVITSNPELELPDDVLNFGSVEEAIEMLSKSTVVDRIFVIGGGEIYRDSILHPDLNQIYLTKVNADYKCDVFFPDAVPEEFEVLSASETMDEDGLEYSYFILGK